ncbi:Mitogen-activated protein kinase HOG1 [Beauveria bassiana]|nr:Mitogen-activated protein kinase HOG1 [Beauveria bassiana]KAH8719831.1 Mitogen-activated protein kinase HOG1 [Beauveria bassiana]KAH8719832.1 Mitogen-activated protein kinase HOG1 [Beauveria bassiana]
MSRPDITVPLMLTWRTYDVEIDIWSAGCIFAEMLEGKPLFPGKNHVDQFYIITKILGPLPIDVINAITSENARKYVKSMPTHKRQPLKKRIKTADNAAIDLLERILVFDHKKRITASQALMHENLTPYHDPADEPVAKERFDWSFSDADLPVDIWKMMVYSDILKYHQAKSVVAGMGREKISQKQKDR